MKNSSVKPGKKKLPTDEKLKDQKLQEEASAPEQSKDKGDDPKVSRAHDFSHTHPTHAHHKTFGMDHEPGAF
ncbi:MAG TPA: hypothetical protein VLZ28_01340 [Daejeonella sp.]|nr:hypothetical protein [Daejeonella sp.]